MQDTRDKILSARYVAPVFTPRDKDRNVNYAIIPKYVDYLISAGVQGKIRLISVYPKYVDYLISAGVQGKIGLISVCLMVLVQFF